ncbi:MAG: ABC transporter permease [Schleiferiaceae bacterium]|nr:ABC transporter permease [Schleiferiaceae bacterium]
MSTLSLIIKREFLTRVKKKSFLVITLLGPILLATLMIAPALIATLPDDNRTIMVLDQPGILNYDKGSEKLALKYADPKTIDLEKAKELFQESEHYALLYIPSGSGFDPDFFATKISLFGKKDISITVENQLRDLLKTNIENEKLKIAGVDPEVIAQNKTKVSIKTINLSDKEESVSFTPVKMALGYISGFFIYFFIFFYAGQVMRGVIEEKTNRIVEVIISSVKPRQLMLGKITGIGLVGLVQFLIWVVLSGVIYLLASTVFLKEKFDTAALAQQDSLDAVGMDKGMEIMNALLAIDWPIILGSFLFFFLGGYLLYSALFAAIGSAVDNETDSQQFMLPITIPLIVAILVTLRVIENPDGALAFWFSIFPLTSPIVMMVRIPFGVPLWELGLSVILLLLAFYGVTALAAKIYRVGILMYGKKVTYKELYKWLRFKS